MNFWNNPEYTPLKVLLIAIVAGVGGGFIYTSMNKDGGDTARLIGANRMNTSNVTPASNLSSDPSLTGTGTTAGTTGATGTTVGTTGTTTSGTTTMAATTSGLTTGGAIQGGTTTKTGTDGVDGRDFSCDTSVPIALTASLVSGPSTTSVNTASGGATNATWMTYRLTNPSDCAVVVSKTEFYLDTSVMDAWPPAQYAKLMNAGVQRGATLLNGATTTTYALATIPAGVSTITVGSSAGINVGDKVKFSGWNSALGVDTTGYGTVTAVPTGTSLTVNVTTAGSHLAGQVDVYGPRTLTFLFPGTSAVTVGAHSSQIFRLMSDSKNVPPAIGPSWMKFQLRSFYSRNALSGTANTQVAGTPGFPSTIITPAITIY